MVITVRKVAPEMALKGHNAKLKACHLAYAAGPFYLPCKDYLGLKDVFVQQFMQLDSSI